MSLFNSRDNLWLILPVLIAFATGSQPAFGQSVSSLLGEPAEESTPIVRQKVSLAGSLENNNGLLRLNLTNNSAAEFRGVARIALGGDAEQREIGQLDLILPPQETRLLRLSGVAASGSHFTLTIYDAKGSLVLYRIAPLKQVSDSTPETVVTLSPIAAAAGKSIASATKQTPGAAAAITGDNESSSGSPEVQILARLLADETETDQFIIAFELSSPRPIYNATLTVNLGKRRESKPVSINLQSSLQFKMPGQPPSEQISYLLTHKSGRVLAKGEIDLGELISDETVTVADIRTDRAGYEPGDAAKLTFLLEGQTPHGCRIEIVIKDGQGTSFFRDQKQISTADLASNHEFSVALPRNAVAPVLVEFKVYDAENGLLFDSGEREIPLKKKG